MASTILVDSVRVLMYMRVYVTTGVMLYSNVCGCRADICASARDARGVGVPVRAHQVVVVVAAAATLFPVRSISASYPPPHVSTCGVDKISHEKTVRRKFSPFVFYSFSFWGST